MLLHCDFFYSILSLLCLAGLTTRLPQTNLASWCLCTRPMRLTNVTNTTGTVGVSGCRVPSLTKWSVCAPTVQHIMSVQRHLSPEDEISQPSDVPAPRTTAVQWNQWHTRGKAVGAAAMGAGPGACMICKET